jgi:hypothetical protein
MIGTWAACRAILFGSFSTESLRFHALHPPKRLFAKTSKFFGIILGHTWILYAYNIENPIQSEEV